jgi:hypothetical protein
MAQKLRLFSWVIAVFALLPLTTMGSNAAAASPSAPTSFAFPNVVTGMAPTLDGNGYWILTSWSGVYYEGDAQHELTPLGPQSYPAVAIETDPVGRGFWMVQSDGNVFPPVSPLPGFVNNDLPPSLNKPIVGMAMTTDGNGYYLVASDGGVFTFGDAVFQGSMGGRPLNQPIVGMALDRATGGYWLVAADGGVFSFDAPFSGSTGAMHLNEPIVGMEAAPDGSGYRMVASDGGVFSFNLPFSGSMGGMPLNEPIVGMAPHGAGGYWLVAADGGIFNFGGAPFLGSAA